MERRLYRSRQDRVIAGVCGGIAEYFDVDPNVVRLVAIVLAIASFGAAAVAYLVMAIVVPEQPGGILEGSDTPVAETPGPTELQPRPDAVAPPGAPPAPPTSYPAGGEQPPSGHRPRGGGIWFGIVLVALGVILLASQFAPGLDLWRLWPLIIVVIGIRILIRGRER